MERNHIASVWGLSLLLIMLHSYQLFAADSGVLIDEVLFAPSVEDYMPVDPVVKPGGTLRAPRLYCWVKLKGGEQALETLRKEQRLPLRHVWISAGPVGFRKLEGTDSDQEAFAKEVDILKSTDRVALTSQIQGSTKDSTGFSPAFSQEITVGKIHNSEALGYEVASLRKSFDWRIWSYLRKSLLKGASYGVVITDKNGHLLTTENGDRVFLVTYGGN